MADHEDETKRQKTIHRDPELYARMAIPYDTQEEARDAGEAFLEAVRGVRVQHRIAEVLVVAAVHVKPAGEEAPTTSLHMTNLGSSELAADLAAQAFEHFARPVLERADRLRAVTKPAGDERLAFEAEGYKLALEMVGREQRAMRAGLDALAKDPRVVGIPEVRDILDRAMGRKPGA